MHLQRLKPGILHLGLCWLMVLTGTHLRAGPQTAPLFTGPIRSAFFAKRMGWRAGVGAQAPVGCESELPPQAQKAVAAKLKHWKVLTAADLPVDDREIWEDDYDEKCPGITAGQFGPKQSQAYAVTLVRSMDGALYQTLVLVAEKDQRYQVTTLSQSQRVAAPSIVRRLPAGSYSSPEGNTQIEAAFNVIAYERIQAGTVIYYWNKSKYRNLIVSE